MPGPWQWGLPAACTHQGPDGGGGRRLGAAVSSRLGWRYQARREPSHGMMFSKCLLGISRVGDLM